MDELTREVMKVKLLKQFPGLVAFPADDWSAQLTTAAKNVRFELKAAFPGVKFSVKTQRYTGGDSLNVAWTDGPTTKQVDAIIQKYQGGSFNGMEDYYEYGNNVFNDIFGDAKYVFANRSYSNALVAECIAKAVAEFGGEPITVDDYRNGRAHYWSNGGGVDMGRELNVIMSETAK